MSLRVSEDLWEALSERAAQEDRSVNYVVTHLLRDALEMDVPTPAPVVALPSTKRAYKRAPVNKREERERARQRWEDER